MPVYVDSSVVVAVALSEPGCQQLRNRLKREPRVLASNLLEAELRAALRREEVDQDPALFLRGIEWVFPRQPLTRQLDRILSRTYLKGADAWHLACALQIAETLGSVRFFSCDRRQLEAAKTVGLETIDGSP